MKVFNHCSGSQPDHWYQKNQYRTKLNLSFNAVSNAVNKLVELGILRQTENVRRSQVFAYEDRANAYPIQGFGLLNYRTNIKVINFK